MFNKVLIANRGEIACRIIKSCRAQGMETIAIYSEADAQALHVQLADHAYCCGPAESNASYLNQTKIIQIAKQAEADAIHPGYGFLAENAEFAEQCIKANLIFIGPPASAIRSMGSKAEAKKIMAKAGVPMLSGYHDHNNEEQTLQNAADKIGYPLLIKAASGGGGKGMRIVKQSADFPKALAAAQREGQASFGDAQVILEQYLANPRHIEVQVFADQEGNCVYLFERECSIQRRRQKIIEEAPAFGLSEKLRKKIGKIAVQAAKAIHYVGAGTIEFLLDGEQFYFMEMNTRIQVEHPVTEMITGIDLVDWQCQIACGAPLPCKQADLSIRGHAIEARIYAEDPNQNFLPATGKLHKLHWPAVHDNLRIDTGIQVDDQITAYYDPMIAKVITWGEDRQTATQILQKALAQTVLVGPNNNLAFLQKLISSQAFADNVIHTQTLDQDIAAYIASPELRDEVLLFVCVFHLHQAPAEGQSPWATNDNWRLNHQQAQKLEFVWQDKHYHANIYRKNTQFVIEVANTTYLVSEIRQQDHDWKITISGQQHHVIMLMEEDTILIVFSQQTYRLQHHDPITQATSQQAEGKSLNAPLPGRVVAVIKQPGQNVKQGTDLIVIEAMKMEHTIHAPNDGVVEAVHYQVGDQVNKGAELLSIKSVDEVS